MRKLKITKIAIDLKYEARDGKIFEEESRCKRYEEELDYQEFAYDESKAISPLTEENWKHWMYKFMQTFIHYPLWHVEFLQEENFIQIEHDEKHKEVRRGFDLNKVREFFAQAFWEIPTHEKDLQNQRYQQNSGYGRHVEPKRKYKEEITKLSLYKFMFESELLKFEDILSSRGNDFYRGRAYFDKDENHEALEKKRMEEVKKSLKYHFFLTSFQEDSTEILDIAIKYLGLDLCECLGDAGLSGSCSSSSLDLYKDFITHLVIGNFSDRGIGAVDDKKRVKWLTYFLQKDFPLRLFKYRTGKTIYEDGRLLFTSVKEGEQKYIYHSIQDLIEEVKTCKADSNKYIFKKNNDKVVELLTNHCGPKFIKANEENKLPEYFQLAKDTVEEIKKIFSQYQEIDVLYNERDLFDVCRIVDESMPRNAKDSYNYRSCEEIWVNFTLDVLNQKIEGGKTDVCVVRNYEKKSYGDSNFTNRKVLRLSDYKNKPKELAHELTFILNDEQPFGKTVIEKITDIDLKLFNIQKQKELLAQEEAQLLKSKNKKR